MSRKKLLQDAESGNVSAMMRLAEYYDKKSRRVNDDQVGDVMTMKDFLRGLNDDTDDKPDFKTEAYKYYRMAAEAGNAKAMTAVAHRLYDGIGVEKNVAESKIWYRRGAETGDPSAMRVVAFDSDDPAEKFKYFKLSAELLPPSLNKQDSIKETAICYATGRGTEKNLAEAKNWIAKLDADHVNWARIELARITGENFWLEQAAETSPEAMIQIAEQFVLKDDFVTALTWYKKAAANGSPDAMSIIGDIYYIGENGVDQDYSTAFAWYKRAADLDYNMAKIKLTLMLYRGRGVKQDLRQAFKNFSEISWTREKFFGPFRFNSVAGYYAAKMRENGEGCDKDPVDVAERYKVAGGLERITDYESARSIPKAIYKVADAFFLGAGERQNFAKSLNFYKKTFTDGDGKTPYHREAAKKVMWMYELGEGVPVDKTKAAEWREKI